MYDTRHAQESEELREVCYSLISYLQNQVLKLQQSVQHRDKHMAKVRLISKQNAFITSTSVSTTTTTNI